MIKFKDLAKCEDFKNFILNIEEKPIVINISEIRNKKYNICERVKPLEESKNDKDGK